MNKITCTLILVLASLASAFAGVIYSGKYFSNIIGEYEEETRLQTLAYSQSLLENLDAEKYASVRVEIVSAITASIFNMDAGNAYAFKYRDACLLHQIVYEYRNKFPEKYIPESEAEEMVQKILEMWSEKDCEMEPKA